MAELGCCHLGKIEKAKELIKLACLCNADYVKFQKRNPIECVPKELHNKPHPNQSFAYGETYLKHRENLELSILQHYELKEFCDHIGIGYSSSVWDVTSAYEIIGLKPDFIKVGSPTNSNRRIIEILFDEYQGDIHIALGMSSYKEIDDLVLGFIVPRNAAGRVVLYHCTSEYPCPFERLYLLEILRLREKYEHYGFRFGFSHHGFGISSDLAAWTLGAEWIERHFVDDRTIKHTDVAASLEPDGLRRLCRDLSNAYRAMAFKPGLTDGEKEQRKKLRGH